MLAPTVLTCPHCRAALSMNAGARRAECENGHHFDVAKQGYMNLLSGRATKHRSDTTDMLQHRDAFLDRNIHAPVLESIAMLIQKHAIEAKNELGTDKLEEKEAAIEHAATDARGPGAEGSVLKGPALNIVDLGVGTGYYLDEIAKRLKEDTAVDGTGLDLSVAALKRYRSRRPVDLAVAWDLWRPLPLADASFDVALSIFAPRNISETARILRARGIAIFVIPETEHLRELRDLDLALDVAPGKWDQLESELFQHDLEVISSQRVTGSMRLDRDAVLDLIQMGPMAFHRDATQTQELLNQMCAPVTEVQLDVRVGGAHRRRTS